MQRLRTYGQTRGTAMIYTGSAQVLCKAQHVHYTLWPVESYEEMQAICAEEFQDDTVKAAMIALATPWRLAMLCGACARMSPGLCTQSPLQRRCSNGELAKVTCPIWLAGRRQLYCRIIAQVIRIVMMVNCGACEAVQDVRQHLPANTRLVVVDSHRPIHHRRAGWRNACPGHGPHTKALTLHSPQSCRTGRGEMLPSGLESPGVAIPCTCSEHR